MDASATVVQGKEKGFLPPPPHNVSHIPRWCGSQTSNLAVINPPCLPSGHSCPPHWLLICSCGKLDASNHKVHSRCFKCHNITTQVVEWQRGRICSSAPPGSLFCQDSHAETRHFYNRCRLNGQTSIRMAWICTSMQFISPFLFRRSFKSSPPLS